MGSKEELEAFLHKCCLYKRLSDDNPRLMEWPDGLKEKYDKATAMKEAEVVTVKPRPHELISGEKLVTSLGVETLYTPENESVFEKAKTLLA